jgi:TPR repeat protein
MHDVSRLSATRTDAALNATTGSGSRAQPFEPAAVRYIKLGENGKWAASAIEQGIIPFDYPAVDHQACVTGDWDRVRDQLVEMGRTSGGVSQGLRELKEFYELPDDARGQFAIGRAFSKGAPMVLKDLVRAYFWLSLAAAQGIREAAHYRDRVGHQMTPEQTSESQSLAAEWQPMTPEEFEKHNEEIVERLRNSELSWGNPSSFDH